MDDLPTMQVCQPIKHAVSNFPQHLFSRSPSKFLNLLVNAVEATAFTELHRDGDCPRRPIHESAIITANMIGRTILVEIELANDLLLHVGVRIRRDDLPLDRD